MSALQPQYRLTLYAPRSVDATETTVLTPRAGAVHSDLFQVANVQGLAGFQPFLDGFRGRRSAIDPLEKKTDTGQLTFRVLDKAVGTNAQRWVTAFLGDAKGVTQLVGRRCLVQESLDGGTTWPTFFTGRVADVRLTSKLWWEMEVREATDDLDVDVFVTQPASALLTPGVGVAPYATMAPVAPNGLLYQYGDFPRSTPLLGKIASQASGGTLAFRVDVDRTDGDLSRTLITQPLIDLAGYGIGSDAATQYGRGVVMISTNVAGPFSAADYTAYDFDFAHTTEGTSLTAVQARPLKGSTARPALGTAVRFYIQSLVAKPSTSTPIYVNDVHPITLLKDLCAGKFGYLDASGHPSWKIPTGATLDALELDTTLPKMRFRITARTRLNDFAEKNILRPLNLAYYFDASGTLQVADLRRTATITPATTITTADLDASDSALAWTQGRDDAVTSVTSFYYPERYVTAANLPKPFTPIPATGNTAWPDVAAGRVEDAGDSYAVRVEDLGLRALDVKAADYQVDAQGFRFRVGDNGAAGETVDGTVSGKPRSTAITEYLTGLASDLRGPFALGPMYVDLVCRRTSPAVALAVQGVYIVLNVDALPDPATGVRGGQRLGLIVERTEDGPRVTLHILDAGANAVAVGPSLSAFAVGSDTVRQATVAVAPNANGDVVRVEYAQTAVGAASPATGWALAATVKTAQTLTLQVPNGGRRLWLRARTEPAAGQTFQLPSGWVTPTNAAFVDLASVAAPTGFTATPEPAAVLLTWTAGDDTLTPVLVIDGAHVEVLPAGSSRYEWIDGDASVTSTFQLYFRDAAGVASVPATATAAPIATTLTAPDDATPWAGSRDLTTGAPKADGTYGVAVAATIVPGYVDITEAVETATGSGVFGPFTLIGTVGVVQGAWTVWSGAAPNDGRRRQLAARSRRGSSVSGWTDAVEVVPWTPLELPPFQRGTGGTTPDATDVGTELYNLVFTESDTGRVWTWSRGNRVAFVWVFDRLAQVPVAADPWPDLTDLPDAILQTGADSYTQAKPPIGYQRFVMLQPFYQAGAVYKRGPALKLTLEPVASAGAPTARGVALLSPTGDAEDVRVLVESPALESLTLTVRDGDAANAPVYTLCASATDASARFVTSGTELGPTDFFADGAGHQTTVLSLVPLKRDQVRRLYVRATGQNSGLAGAWTPIALSLLQKPYLESIAATWDESTGKLRVRVVGSAHCASVLVQVDSDPFFGTALSSSANLADGAEFTALFALSGAQRGKTWYARATPYNLAGQTGLPGNAAVDEVAVPAKVTYDLQAPAQNQLKLTVYDAGGFVDPQQRVAFYVTVMGQPRALRQPTSAPANAATAGDYTITLTLDAKHATLVEPVIYLVDGSQIRPSPATFDANTTADFVSLGVAYLGSVATVTAVLDTDAKVGTGNFEYSLNSGASWTPVDIPATRVVQVAVAMSSVAKTPVSCRAKDSTGAYGPIASLEVSRYDAPGGTSSGPTLTVIATPSSLTYTVSWSGSPTPTYYVDGVQNTLQASPFPVFRPGVGSAPRQLTFTNTQAGQTVSESVTVVPIDGDTDTVAPDVQLLPAGEAATTLSFTAYAVNPKTAGYIAATVIFSPGCTGTVNGTLYGAGSTVSVNPANGVSVVVNRPAIGASPATVRLRASIAGGGSAEVARTVSEQTKDFTPPVFEPVVSSTANTVSATWAAPAAGVSVYAQTDGSGWAFQSSTAYLVSRNVAGGATKTMYLKAVNAAGVENVKTFEVPPAESAGTGGGGTPTTVPTVYDIGLSARAYAASGDMHVYWYATALPSGGSYQVTYKVKGMTSAAYAGSSSIESLTVPETTHGVTFDSSGNTVPSLLWIEFSVKMLNASGQVISTVGPSRFDSPLP